MEDFPVKGTADITVQLVHSAFGGTAAWNVVREELDAEEG